MSAPVEENPTRAGGRAGRDGGTREAAAGKRMDNIRDTGGVEELRGSGGNCIPHPATRHRGHCATPGPHPPARCRHGRVASGRFTMAAGRPAGRHPEILPASPKYLRVRKRARWNVYHYMRFANSTGRDHLASPWRLPLRTSRRRLPRRRGSSMRGMPSAPSRPRTV